MRADIVTRDVREFNAIILTMPLWISMTKWKAKDYLVAEKCAYIVIQC